MSHPASRMDTECRAFCRYLVGADPSPYVVACYLRALPGAAGPSAPRLVDRAAVTLARSGRAGARIADAYCRRFRPYGTLRRRLILLLAILENAPPTADPLNRAREGPRVRLLVELALALLGSGLATLLGVLLLGPLHLLSGNERAA